jgi:hypothetical protein
MTSELEQRLVMREVSRLLPERFPELRASYDREIAATNMEDDAPLLNYAQLFVPFLERALREEPDGSELLDRIFVFLAELAEDPRREFSEIATLEVAEFLESRPELLKRAWPRLSPAMRAVVRRPWTSRVRSWWRA